MKGYKLDFIASIAILAIIFALNGYFRKYHIDKHGYKKGNLKTNIIYDMGHTYLPLIWFDGTYKDVVFQYIRHLIVGFPILLAIVFLDWEHKVNFLLDLSVLYLIRMIANNLTVLPSIRPCDVEKDTTNVGGCCDLMFSGHTLSCLIATLYYMYYISDRYSTLLLIFNFINQFLILANRKHYSDDVFLAWFVTLTVFFLRTNDPRKVMTMLFNTFESIF